MEFEEQSELSEAAAQEESAPVPEIPADELLRDELLPDDSDGPAGLPVNDAQLKAVLEAIIYITDEPLSLEQISAAMEQPKDRVAALLETLLADYDRPDRGLSIREVAGGYKMATKPEHHEAVRRFVKNLNPPLKMSLPALETLAVIAYKQPITAPEIMEIRGVQGAGVLKTLIDRKLIATAGRKQVVGKPILYKTTREFLVQFGLRDIGELPTLKEFQELARFDGMPDQGATEKAEEPRPGKSAGKHKEKAQPDQAEPDEPMLFPPPESPKDLGEEDQE